MNQDVKKIELELHKRLEKEKQDAFDVALHGDRLLRTQFDNDFLIILEPLKDWIEKSKNEEQKSKLKLMVKALLRINIYASNQHTLAKTALSDSIISNRMKTNMALEASEIKKKIVYLKQQLEFHEKTK